MYTMSFCGFYTVPLIWIAVYLDISLVGSFNLPEERSDMSSHQRSSYVQEIVIAAHLESERKELELWKNGTEDAHDRSSFLDLCSWGFGIQTWREREALSCHYEL